jgi:hypothetical protein
VVVVAVVEEEEEEATRVKGVTTGVKGVEMVKTTTKKGRRGRADPALPGITVNGRRVLRTF